MEQKLYEIDPSRLPMKVLAAKLIKLEQLAAAVRGYTGYRPLAIQRVLDSMPKLNDRGGWGQLAGETTEPPLTADDFIREDFE